MLTHEETIDNSQPWSIERVPIQSRGGSNSCWKIGKFQACIYDDCRQRERGFSEADITRFAHVAAGAPATLTACKAMIRGLQKLEALGHHEVYKHMGDELRFALDAVAVSERTSEPDRIVAAEVRTNTSNKYRIAEVQRLASELLAARRTATIGCLDIARLAMSLAAAAAPDSDVRRQALEIVSEVTVGARNLDALSTAYVYDVAMSDDIASESLPSEDDAVEPPI